MVNNRNRRTLCLNVVEGNLRKVQGRQHVHAIRLCREETEEKEKESIIS